MSVSYRNRTYNRVLGGPRYIHLTKETNAVFPGFFDPLAPAAIIYNSNTFVMNYLFPISSDFSDFASLSDPQTLPFFFKRVPPWFYLRRRLLYPFNYGNIVRETYLYRIAKIPQNSKSYDSANFTVPCIQICPLKRRPTFGSPIRSFWAIPTWKSISLQLIVRS